MKKAKRALALALVFALVASFCVTGAAAEPGPGEQPPEDLGYVKNGEAKTTDDGVTVSKTAEYVSKNKYEITLEVTIPDDVTVQGTDTDVVLVIDSSGSMGNSGMRDAKEAAADFAEELFMATGVNIRVAIVDYDDDATVVQVNGASWLTNSDQVDSALDRISDGGGTHIQGGIHEARKLLASSDNKKVMIVISDGEPTYSFRPMSVSGTITGCDTLLGYHIIEWASVDGKSLEFGGFVYNYQSYWNHNRNGGTLGDGSEPNASWDISWTCEHEGQSGTDKFWYSHAWPTIAEADIAKNAGIEIYSVYIGSLSGDAETTMEGIASGTDHCASTEGTSLSDLLQEIAGSVTSTTAGAVTDPMGKNITLGDVENLAGVTRTETGLTWDPTKSQGQPVNGGTKYTVTYPITVDGKKLTASGWVYANDTTTFTYEVNGEERTAEFNVPKVWGEKPVTEKEQNVYVFVKVTGSGDNDALTEAEQDRVEEMGLVNTNSDGWYTIGVVANVNLPLASTVGVGSYPEYLKRITDADISSMDHRWYQNVNFNVTDSNIAWTDLVVASGANEYTTSGDASLTGGYHVDNVACWHLNGVITLENLEKQFVDVTYYANGGTGNMASQTVPKGSDVTLTANTFTYQGYTFTGWNTEADGNGEGYADREHIDKLNADLTLYAQWSQNTNNITIQVYVDGTKVTLTDDNLDHYISELKEAEGTPTFTYVVESGVIKGTYNYQNYDSADIVLTPNGKYVLQGIKGTFIKGETAWTGITTPSGTAWNIDNVMGGTTLSVYLNTKYSVEYEVPSGFTEPEEDDNTYITVEGLQDVSEPSFEGVADGNEGREGGWTNNNLETTINLKTVPTGTTGWYNENNTQYTQTTLAVSDAAAANSGYDNNGDHIFTFTATANEYTVTYNANATGATGTTADNNTYTHGATVTVLENGFTYAGHTFTGWNTQQDGSGKAYQPNETFEIEENTILYAQWEEITGKLTVTKTVEGLEGNDTLPDAFAITVSGTSGAADGVSYTLTIGMSNGENIKYSYDEASGTHQWVISGAALGTYNVTEANYKVEGYLCEGDEDKTATITDANGEEVTLTNSYTLISRELSVVKTVIKVGETDVEEGAAIPAAKVGETIIYEIVVTNNSNVALENISVTDELVNSVLYSDEGCTVTASATIESLEADGGSATFYAKYKVTAADAEAGSVTNTATAKSGDTTGTGTEEVDVKKQYTLTINHYYDEVGGATVQASAVQTLNEGDSWTATPLTNVDKNGVNYIFDASLSTSPLSGTISGNVTVDLVYVKDEWKDDDPDGDSETGGDGTPDYRQALILYEVAEGQDDMGGVSPTIDVVTLTDDDGDGEYSGSVPAESTATPEDGSVFVEWSWTHDEDGPSTNATLSHEFTAVGGETYTYTASFRAGETDAKVTKTLDSYTRGDAEPTDIPEGFKARVGDVLNYEITIKNIGEVALNTTVRDTIDGKGTLTINPGTGYTVEDGVITITNLAPNDTVTISASYTVVADDIGRTITNTATVDIDDKEPDEDPKDDEEVTVDDYSVTITPADIVAYTGGDGYSAVVGADDEYINNSTSGLPEPGYHVVLSDAVVDWLNDNGVAAGDGLTDDAADLAGVLSFTYDDGTNERNWSLRYVGVYSYNASGNPSAYVYSIVTETAGAPSVSLKYFDDLNEDGEADDNEVITSDDIMMSANQVNHTYKMTIEGGGLDQSQVKAVLKAGGKSLTTDIDIGIGELTVLSTTDEETTNSIAGNAAGVDSGVITAVGNDSITYYVNESGVSFNDEDLVSRVQLLIDEVTNETSGEFETAMAEAAFDAVSADLRNAEYEMCYMDLVDTENGNAKVTFSGGELSIYWPLPDGASASDSFYIVHFTELDREHAAVGTDVLDTTDKDVIAGEVMRIGGEYYVTFDVGSFSPFVLVYGDDGGDEPWWPPIGPGDDDDDGDDGGDGEFVPKWLNIDDHYAYIIGYEDGTVRPQGNITRAEVATIFFRLLTDEVRAEYWSTVSGYTDVKAGDWYNNAISTLSDLGIITGYEDGTFRPNASISRAEFVTIATRFFDYAAEYEGAFSDVSYSSWYADFVQAAVDMGLVNGYENGTFRPNASITRAEAVAIVNRVLLRRPDADHLLPWSVMNTFSDNVLESAWYYEDIQEATNSHDYEWLKSGVEDWTEKLPERDWAALEREWSSAYDAPGGEVTG